MDPSQPKGMKPHLKQKARLAQGGRGKPGIRPTAGTDLGALGPAGCPTHPRLNLISAQNETKAEGTSPAQQFLNAETRSRQPLAGGRGAVAALDKVSGD